MTGTRDQQNHQQQDSLTMYERALTQALEDSMDGTQNDGDDEKEDE